jgi:hypothetical protein
MIRSFCSTFLALVITAWGATCAWTQDALFIDSPGRVGIASPAPDGSPVLEAFVQHSVVQVRDQFGNSIPHNHGIRFPSGSPAIDSFFDIFVELAPGGNWTVDSFFDITYRIELQGVSGSPPPVLLSPSGTFAVDSFFDITYRIDASKPGRPKYGDITLKKGFIDPAVELIDLTISSNNWAVDSFFDITYRIAPVNDPPTLSLSSPLLSIRMTGHFVPEPASAALLVLGGAMLLSRRKVGRKAL